MKKQLQLYFLPRLQTVLRPTITTTLLFTALASSLTAHGISAQDAWAHSTVLGQNIGGVFMQLKNDKNQNDTLIGASTDVARRVEIHTHMNDRGILRMNELKNGLSLPAKDIINLAPGGYHMMLLGLKKPLQPGQTFNLTLKFKHAPEEKITVTVKPLGHNSHHHHHNHEHQHH